MSGLDAAADEGRNALPGATDDQANAVEELAAQVLADNAMPTKDMVIWWSLLRPDRLAIADELDRWARDYDRATAHEGARALRDAARWVRASAGGAA